LRLDVGGGRGRDLTVEVARKVTCAHARLPRQRWTRQIAIRMIGDPGLDFAQTVSTAPRSSGLSFTKSILLTSMVFIGLFHL
jgi:hypothetical protein